MRSMFRLLTSAAFLLVLTSTGAHAVYPGTSWTQRTPAAVGLNVTKLGELRTATGNLAGVVVRDGYLVYTWGNPVGKFDWASSAKPVVSTLLLFAVKEGKLPSVDARLSAFWNLRSADQTMTFRHLANMTSGYALPENPGPRWGYNDYAISLYVKTLFPKVFKQKPDVVARGTNRLGPLQFQDGAIFGTTRGGYGLYTSPRDFARIGWFWLNKGNWRGTQLLPVSYFNTFMKTQVPANMPRTAGGPIDDYLFVGSSGGGTNQDFPGQGRYGFNWWFNPHHVTWPEAPVDTIMTLGHRCKENMAIIPRLRLVVAWKGTEAPVGQAFAACNRYLKILVEATQ
jgi:CubicO group peptidase (beta-lactamase class C family)